MKRLPKPCILKVWPWQLQTDILLIQNYIIVFYSDRLSSEMVTAYFIMQKVNSMEMILFTTGFAVTLATVLIVEACID